MIGGPPEFKTRADGIVGLKKIYGLTFKQFQPLDEAGPVTVAALKSGKVQAADLFTTDPSIILNKFVVLQDPKNLFAAQNVTPLVCKKGATPTTVAALNAVSAKLTTCWPAADGQADRREQGGLRDRRQELAQPERPGLTQQPPAPAATHAGKAPLAGPDSPASGRRIPGMGASAPMPRIRGRAAEIAVGEALALGRLGPGSDRAHRG